MNSTLGWCRLGYQSLPRRAITLTPKWPPTYSSPHPISFTMKIAPLVSLAHSAANSQFHLTSVLGFSRIIHCTKQDLLLGPEFLSVTHVPNCHDTHLQLAVTLLVAVVCDNKSGSFLLGVHSFKVPEQVYPDPPTGFLYLCL